MIGKKILSYEIKSLIGEGGMGSVYLAEDPLLKRKVAIKAVLPHLAKNANIRRRFEEEVKAMSRLSHKNIVQFIDYQINENGLCLIMEYLDGDPLNVYMKKLGSALDEDLAIEITRQVVAACSHAHSKGVIHRDIKPSNIVIGKTGVVKILDFGIAKIAKDQEVQKLTKTGSQIGTIYYMSPEQVQGAPITPATDIYSIGVTLFQMVTGIRPYRNELVEFKVYKRIVNEPLPNVQKINPNLTVFIQKVIEKATQKEPEKRFKNGKAFHAALGKKEAYLKKIVSRNKGKESNNKEKSDTNNQRFDSSDQTENRRQNLVTESNASSVLILSLVSTGFGLASIFSLNTNISDTVIGVGLLGFLLGALTLIRSIQLNIKVKKQYEWFEAQKDLYVAMILSALGAVLYLVARFS